jgi:hypothetical protein
MPALHNIHETCLYAEDLAAMAMFPFTGAKGSFFGDLHIQGKEGIAFYTQSKMILSRWHGETGKGGGAGELVTTRG